MIMLGPSLSVVASAAMNPPTSRRLTAARDAGARIVSNMFSIPGFVQREKRLAKGLPVYLY